MTEYTDLDEFVDDVETGVGAIAIAIEDDVYWGDFDEFKGALTAATTAADNAD